MIRLFLNIIGLIGVFIVCYAAVFFLKYFIVSGGLTHLLRTIIR